MRMRSRLEALAPLLLALVACGGSESTTQEADASAGLSAAGPTSWIYRDAMVAPWADWSWARHSLSNTRPVAAGTRSISVTMGPTQGLYFNRSAFAASGYAAVTLSVHGGTRGANAVLLVRAILANGSSPSGVQLGPTCAAGAVLANAWTTCRIPLASIAPAGASLTGVVIQEGAGKTLPTLYFDEIGLEPAAPPAAVSVSVAPATATVGLAQGAQLTATVSGTTNSAVAWSVQEGPAGGSVSASGAYTAPTTAGTFHVVATSQADTTKSAIATITVGATAPPPAGWLSTSGNRILSADGTPWHGRGANLADTRGCGACTFNAPSPAEVMRRIDELVDVWHANFIRLDLESYASANGQVNWAGVLADPSYLADLQTIVAHAASKPGVYVLLSLWVDPTFTTLGWPTASTNTEWAKLAGTFKNEPRVLFGLSNEPESNFDGAQDAQVWAAMNSAVQTIRDVETVSGTPHHVITAQGTRSWARRLDYYLTHPITAGGGVNIAYETHVYDPTSQFAVLFETPSATLPVVIGEFGPAAGFMTEAEASALMASAELHGVPYLAWTFHMRCSPNLLVDSSNGSCGIGMPLTPTSWGTLLKNRLAQPW